MKDRIEELKQLMKAEIQKGCKACNELGLYHCAYPDECGVWDELYKLEKELISMKETP